MVIKNDQKGNFTGKYKQIKSTTVLAINMLGEKVNDKFEFGGVGY